MADEPVFIDISSTETDLGSLSLSRVRVLICDGAGIGGLSALKGLRSLRILTLSGCSNVGSLDPLRGLKLDELDISATLVDDISPLLDMDVKALRIGGTSITNAFILERLTTIRDVSFLPSTNYVPYLQRNPYVERLHDLPAEEFWRRYPALIQSIMARRLRPEGKRRVFKLEGEVWPAERAVRAGEEAKKACQGQP